MLRGRYEFVFGWGAYTHSISTHICQTRLRLDCGTVCACYCCCSMMEVLMQPSPEGRSWSLEEDDIDRIVLIA